MVIQQHDKQTNFQDGVPVCVLGQDCFSLNKKFCKMQIYKESSSLNMRLVIIDKQITTTINK